MADTSPQSLGRYTIHAELGKGGFATVYRATDTVLERDVALKILKPGWTDDRKAVERFMREARVASRLDHPGIVTIYDVGETEGRLYIAMKLLPGQSLDRLIKSSGPLTWDRTLAIMMQAAEALDYAHAQGLVHRDIKPANLIVDENDHVVLTDFGLVRGAEQASLSTGTTGGILGTPEYIPPEVWEGQPATKASDIYSLACVVYEMLFGNPLFAADTGPAVMRKHVLIGPEFPANWPLHVPNEIPAILRQALAHEPNDRYATAGALVNALREDTEAQEAREQAVREQEAREQEARAARQKQEEAERAAQAALAIEATRKAEEERARQEAERKVKEEADRQAREEQERQRQAELAAQAAAAEKAKQEAAEHERQRQAREAAKQSEEETRRKEMAQQKQIAAQPVQRARAATPLVEATSSRTWLYVAGGIIAIVVIGVLFASTNPFGGAATPGPAPTQALAVPPTEALANPTKPPQPTDAPITSSIDCMGAKQGDTISMLYQWSGQEEAKLNQILEPLVKACGIVFKPESTRDQALLDTRVQAGTPPDIAFWNVAQLVQYKDKLFPMNQVGANRVNYADFFMNQGTVDGKWLGLPVKAYYKTIIWYSPVVFQAKGYDVPKTWDELNALVEKMVANGDVPWSMGFESGDATGWTGSDFIQDIMLVQQGPQYVLDIISGKVPYNDAGVKQAYETYGKWATDPKYTVGGAQGTLSTSFLDAIYKPFTVPPDAMMVNQAGFAGSEIQKKFPGLQYGTDYDFFPVPGAQGLQGGADWMMAFSDKPAVKALVAYLSSIEGGASWAKAGFDLSPNKSASGYYTDPALIKYDKALASVPGFTPDIGDTIPGGFGKAEWTAIINYINGKNLDTELANVAKVQAEATKK